MKGFSDGYYFSFCKKIRWIFMVWHFYKLKRKLTCFLSSKDMKMCLSTFHFMVWHISNARPPAQKWQWFRRCQGNWLTSFMANNCRINVHWILWINDKILSIHRKIHPNIRIYCYQTFILFFVCCCFCLCFCRLTY